MSLRIRQFAFSALVANTKDRLTGKRERHLEETPAGIRQEARQEEAGLRKALSDGGFQLLPSKVGMEEGFDMPGADMETLRRAFFKPRKPPQIRYLI